MSMRKLLTISGFIPVFLVSLILSSCEDDETIMEPTATDIAGVPYVGAYSANETTVQLVWTPSPDEGSTQVLNPAYLIKVKDATGAVLQNLTAAKGLTTFPVSGLTEGTVYTFVISMSVDSTAVTDDSASVVWSPAKRSETEGNPPIPILVYETASTTFFSGLDLYSATLDGPQTLQLTGPSNSLIDLYVYTDPGSQDLIIRSAHLSTVIPTPKTTFFSTEIDSSDDLSFDRPLPPDAGTYSTSAVTISGSASGITEGRIIYGKTLENNYFRLLVRRNNTSLVFGTSPNRFLTVEISYQSVSGVPYARPVNPEHELSKRF